MEYILLHAMEKTGRERKKKKLISIYTAISRMECPASIISRVSRDCLVSFTRVACIVHNFYVFFCTSLNLVLYNDPHKNHGKQCSWLNLFAISCFFQFSFFFLSFLLLLVALSCICAEHDVLSSPYRDIRLIRTCYSRRWHKDDTLMSGEQLPAEVRPNFPFRYTVAFSVL